MSLDMTKPASRYNQVMARKANVAAKKITAKQIEDELRKRVVTGTPEEQKRKAEWFKSHVIIDMGK